VPIRARPAGPWLRARRWVERSPVAAAALASVVLALATALTTTLVLLGRARAESVARERALIAVGQARSRAEAGFAGAIDAADHMLTRVAMDAFYDAPGTEVVGRKLLEDARDLCREFIDSHGGDSRLREQMGRACLNLGRFTSSLEGYAAALPHLEEGLWMLAPFATGPPETVRVLAELHETMALQLANLGRASPADAHHAVAAALREELLARAPHDRSLAIAAVHGDYLEGNECLVLGRKRDAERCFLRLLVRCERLAGAHDPAEPYVRVHALLALAMALGEPRNAEAQEYCCQAIAELEALPKHTLELESKLALAWEMNGALLEKAGDLPGAASALRNALRCLAEPGPHAPPGSVRWIRIMRARYWSKLAVILHQTGAPLETEAAWEAAFEHESEVFAQPQGNPAEAFELTDVCVRWAMIHAEGRGWDARSEAGVRNALELREQQLRRHPEQPHAWQRCAEAHELLGRFERRPVEAEDHLRRALELHDRGLAVSEGEWWTRLTRAEFLLRLGKHRTSQGRRVDAERCLTLADEECEQLGRERPADRRRVRVHANVLEKLAFSVESYSRMEAVLVRLVELLQRFLKDNDPDLDQMRYWTAAGRLATIRWTFLRGIEARGQLREVVRWFREEVRREPRHVAARIELALALGSLALGHEQRGNLEEALETVQETQKQLYEVAALAPREPRWRDPLREGHRLYVQLLQREGDVRAVLAETDRLLAVDPGSVEDAWTAAVALGRSAGNRSADPDDAGVYAAKALAALREAVHRGLRDSARIQLERALDSLREREDFQRLVRALRPDAR
jgi:tetratricopeptide (TPR) repeat protein